MISQVNSVAVNTQIFGNTQHGDKAKLQEQGVSSDVSSVVSLQGSNIQGSRATGNKLDASGAASFAADIAADIAAMLGAGGGSVQEHLNGFDAARLLAD